MIKHIFTDKSINQRIVCKILLALKVFVTVIALSEDTLSMNYNWTYVVNIPVINVVYTLLEEIYVWGIEKLFLFIGIAALYYLAGEQKFQKNR